MDAIIDENGTCTQKKIIETLHSLDPTTDNPPFDLQNFSIEIFSTFLVSLKKANGEKPKVLKRYGVALTYLYTMFDI